MSKKTLQNDLSWTFKLNGTDCSSLILEGNIYQNTLLPYWVFEASIHDIGNAWELGGLQEYPEFSIKLEIEGKKLEFEGNIIGVTPITRQNTMEVTYKIQGVSSNFIKTRNKRLNKYYEGKAHEILQQIISDAGGSLEIKKSSEAPKFAYIANNISPFAAVHQVLQTCFFIKDGPCADFFITYSGGSKYKLWSAQDQWDKGEKGTYKVEAANQRESGNLKDFDNHILQYSHQFYNPAMFESGFYATKVCKYDLINKTWCEETYSYGQENTEQNKKKPWSGGEIENVNRHIIFVPSSCKSGSKYPHMWKHLEKWLPNRRKQLMEWEQDKVTIQISPDPSMHENIGEAYTLEMPSEGDTDKLKYDKYMKGKYLLGNVAHHFNTSGAFTNLEFIKKIEEKKRSG